MSRKKGSGNRNQPARVRYWTSGRLKKKRIGNLMRNNGLSLEEASDIWKNSQASFKTHKGGFIRKKTG